MDEKIQNIIHLIKESDLDDTIKEILIRDLETEGLTDFLREQIVAYCVEGLNRIDSQIEAAKATLEQRDEKPTE